MKAAVLLVALLLAACTPQDASSDLDALVASAPGTVILISNEGFTPSEVSVSKGEVVSFVNVIKAPAWPASNAHPTHTRYPAAYSASGTFMGSEACFAKGQPKPGAFDPCEEIQPGNMWSMTFEEVGRWTYHDHTNPTYRGVIIVE